jgi:hypothetical protein
MSNTALNAVFERSRTKNGARLVMLALADRANAEGKAWPGNDDLVLRTGLSKSAVIKAKNEAVALGELHIEPRRGPHRTNLYTLQILDGADSGRCRIETDTLQILDIDPPDSGPKPSLTLKNPQPLDRARGKVNPKPENAPDFAAFWQAYPRKTAKTQAAKAWRATARHRPPLDELLAAIERHKGSRQWADAQYVPYPATWLNGRRWADELKDRESAKPQPIRVRL